MADAENSDRRVSLRTRKAVLGDITNLVEEKSKENEKLNPPKRLKTTRSSFPPVSDSSSSSNPLVSKSSIKSKKSIVIEPDEIKEDNNKNSNLNIENIRIVPLVSGHISQKDRDINYLTNAREKNDSSQTRIFKRTLLIQSRNKDPSLCLDQIDRMYTIYHQLESIYAPRTYMKNQKDINHKMRSILVDWLIEVHHKFKLQPPTLWLTINLLDRYLEIVPTTRNKLQLVGVSSLLIACKFEEIYPPEVKDCVYITDNAYAREEVLYMESEILKELNYQLLVPTGYHFMSRYLDCIQASDKLRCLTSYYCERNLQEYDHLNYAPHIFAAAGLYAALIQQYEASFFFDSNLVSNKQIWGLALQEQSGLRVEDIKDCASIIVKHVSEESETASKRKLIAAKKKYASEKYFFISTLHLPDIKSI